MSTDLKARAKGAMMGAFIGEALGVGPHWYYDLEKMRAEYGDWISDYTDPKPNRYHGNLKAGDISQSAILMKLLAENLLAESGYDQQAFCEMMDQQFLPELDGKPMGGPGGYTSQSMRYLWKQRVKQGKDWSQVASNADTTEALERNIATAVYYANNLEKLALSVTSNTLLTQSDDLIASLTTAFSALLAVLIQGEKLDKEISKKLMNKVAGGELPYNKITAADLKPPTEARTAAESMTLFSSPDGLMSPAYMARAWEDEGITIEPAWKVSLVYGMPCAIYHVLPAVYYLSARYKDNFEAGVLHALNGGGQNQVRTMLTGALIGAQVGLQGIPQRFLDGLNDQEELLDLTERMTAHL
ncbi:ADP-ribosylglycohydrolase family protein [Halanaerobium salsuginis]|jgi:ADP-ribosylglycohydrolase|uniref:ADP-ribosylglycohydrolase n=1 Tax=Halanaerobium salsuginis TaxID=29563 RepID=A0A1I4KEJ4_9FIRM|nr:ADP-ribosylglycohydrolase family protein [Halanaerobium salsuginis]SFL77148.1 ADP-ribosylglycohydrolase [Halanaerobium salsuginis]